MRKTWRDFLKKGEGEAVAAFRIEQYAELLLQWSKVHNLTALKSDVELKDKLIASSLALDPVLQGYRCVLDLGTGAGIPGLVLAINRPEQKWVLAEKVGKKIIFLKQAVSQLGLKNVTIRSGDFTSMAVDHQVDAIVSRGSAKLTQQAEMTEAWRKECIPLYSVQTSQSMVECSPEIRKSLHEVEGIDSSFGLIVVKVK